MPRQLKVYSWSGFRSDCPPEEDRHGQTHEYVAAHSKAEAVRCINLTRPRVPARVSEVHETDSPAALAKCIARPGCVFWVGLSAALRHKEPSWHEAGV